MLMFTIMVMMGALFILSFFRYDEIINDNKNNHNTKTNNNIKKNNNVVEDHVDPLPRTCFSPDSYFRHILATSGDRYYSKNN